MRLHNALVVTSVEVPEENLNIKRVNERRVIYILI